VLSPPESAGPDGPIWWCPWGVTWSHDGDPLLYLAWPAATADSKVPYSAIVAVRPDGATPPIVLSGDLTPSLYFGP
jgi:hypothetical protein